MPSLYEGFPVSIIEALSVNLNCVLSSNISKETKVINDKVKFLSLDDPIEKWYCEIKYMAYNKTSFENTKEILIKKGFDIMSNVNVLEKIYLGDGYGK